MGLDGEKVFSPAKMIRRQSLGPGLALVKNVVELHGGTVEAFSAGVSQGSEFMVFLPCVRHTEVESSVHFEPEETKAPPTRILVADDNVDSADYLARLLNIAGHSFVFHMMAPLH